MRLLVEVTPPFGAQPFYVFVLKEVRASGTQASIMDWGEVPCLNEEAKLVYQKHCVSEGIKRTRAVLTGPPIDLNPAFGHGKEAMLRFMRPTAKWLH
jgi:hypothetical protein